MSMTHHVRNAVLAGFVTMGGAAATAEPMTFDFKDPKGVNGVVFVMDSKIEPIVGTVGGVEGTVSYDPEKPDSFGGAISVDMATVSLINSTMVEHLKGAKWLNITGPFKATMTFDKVTATSTGEDGAAVLNVEGMMKFGTREVPMTVEVSATHIPEGGTQRGGGKEGDLLVLRSTFGLDRVKLGINPEAPANVGPVITVTVPIAGYAE